MSVPVGREAPPTRDRLLGAAVSYVQEHGLSDISLRELAAAIGTSHRMLIYHFGSKDGLQVAIVHAVEAAQQLILSQLAANPSVGAAETIRAMWSRFADPNLGPQERLFFEIYGQALQGRPGTAGFLDGVVDSWVAVSTRPDGAAATASNTATADARLGVAVMRGLLLDLLATNDRERVDEALERYIALLASSRRR